MSSSKEMWLLHYSALFIDKEITSDEVYVLKILRITLGPVDILRVTENFI